MTDNLKLVAIFAHPDDEAFGTGGTLTKYAHEGVDVHLIMATRGEAGQLANPAITPTHPFSLLREQELRRACEVYGLKQLHLLGYGDGQTAMVPPSEAVYKIVRLLRDIKPQIVLSFGPEGVYGHYDHLVVHRWASASVRLAAETERWPELGAAHHVAKFYHRAMPQSQVDNMQERLGYNSVPMDGIPFPFTGYPIEQITTIVDVRAWADKKAQAIRCHASQIGPDNPILQEDFDPTANDWFWKETFILAQSHGLLDGYFIDDKECDLFAGVRV
ncbi:MAG: PIG-L family deacetylase [Anaerolineae bacterium]|nr:PIG-L family deacetylase [Anaerolineae bacterium]